MIKRVKMIPPWFLMLIFLISATFAQDNEVVDRSKPRCPDDSINGGWYVRKSYAFSNPLDCCGSKVLGWKA